MSTPPKRRYRAYTTRKFPDDLLKRLRVIAAVRTADDDRRVTIEDVMNEALELGVPLLEKETFGK